MTDEKQPEWNHPLAGKQPRTICADCRHRFAQPLVEVAVRPLPTRGDLFIKDGWLWHWLCGAFGDEMHGKGERDWISPVTAKPYITLTPECRDVNQGDCLHFRPKDTVPDTPDPPPGDHDVRKTLSYTSTGFFR